MIKVLVIGKDGMLGHTLIKYLSYNSFYSVIGLGRNEEPYPDIVKNANVVINCAVIKTGDFAEMTYTNVQLPVYLAKHAKKLIHISTESERAKDFYTRTKLIAEQELNKKKNTFILKTSIVGYENGLNARNLIEKARRGEIKTGYINHLWQGVTTIELCRIIEDLLLVHWLKKRIIRVGSPRPICKYHLIKLFGIPIRPGFALSPRSQLIKSDVKTRPIEKQIEDLRRFKNEM